MDAGGMGPLGSGRETPPDAKLTQCDEQAVVSLRPWSGRFVGPVFLALGLTVGVGAFILLRRLGLHSEALYTLGMGLLGAIAGYLGMAPLTLRIEIATRTYKECWGWRLLRKEKAGGGEDFAHLSLRTYYSGGRGTTMLLHWRDPKRRPFALHTSNLEDAQRQGQAVAALLRLPFVQGNGKPVSAVSPERRHSSAGEAK